VKRQGINNNQKRRSRSYCLYFATNERMVILMKLLQTCKKLVSLLCVMSMIGSTMSLQAITLNATTGDVSEAVELDDETGNEISEETMIDSELQRMEATRNEEEAQWHEDEEAQQKQMTDPEPIAEHESLVVTEEGKRRKEAEQTKRPEFGTYSVIGAKRIVEIFPDPVLANVIAQKLGRTNTQARVTQAELNGIKSLSLSYMGKIQNLEGVQYLSELTSIVLRGLKTSDFSVLSNLTKLTDLDMSYSQISDINVLKNLTALKNLNLDSTEISDINVLKNLTALTSLDLYSNHISDISALSNLTNLTYLNMKYNKISDISALNKLTNLKSLYLNNNQISDMSALSSLTNLKSLYLTGNKISDISALSNLTTLDSLNLYDNKINDIGALKRLTNLTYLNISSNKISDISTLSSLTLLRDLYLYNNHISDISALSNLTNLTYLNMNNNQISDISALNKLTNLKSLYLNNNQISDINALKDLRQLVKLNLNNNQISDMSALSNLMALTELDMDNNKINDISGLSNLTKLQSLKLSNNEISDIVPLHKLTALQYVYLSNNHIVDISPLKNTKLPNLKLLKIIDQSNKIIPSILYTAKILVENTVKDIDGNLIAPYSYGPVDSGSYNSPYISWQIPKPSAKTEVTYNWYDDFYVGTVYVEYSGTYKASVSMGLNKTVTYDNDGVVLVEEQAVGDKLQQPNNPEKVGHTFVGWYTEQVGGKQWDFAEDTMPANDLTLYARFTVNKYQVTYIDIDPWFVVDLNFGSKLIEPVMSSKNGAAFIGWYTEQFGGKQWNFATEMMPAHAVTLYARYEESSCPVGIYRIEFQLDGNIISHTCAAPDTEIKKPKGPVKPGYTFVGWYPQEKGGKKWVFKRDMMPAHDVTLYARFKQIETFSVAVHDTPVTRRNDVVETAGSL